MPVKRPPIPPLTSYGLSIQVSSPKLLLLWTIVAIAICGYLSILRAYHTPISVAQPVTLAQHEPGVIDFIQYWSAYRVTQEGLNPYVPENMRKIQTLVATTNDVTMMWNPPWLLLIMAPVLALDLPTAANVWFTLNFVFIAVSIGLCGLLYPKLSSYRVLSFCALLLFPPFWEVLRLGQISLLVTVAILLFGWCLQKRWDFAAGASLSLLSVKPHLAYLLVFVLAWWILKERRFLVFLGGIVGMGTLVGASLLVQGPSMSWWLAAQLHPENIVGAVRTNEWLTATIGGALRAYGGSWLSTHRIEGFVVLGALVPTAWWLVRRRPKISWDSSLPLLLLLSLITAPYGWFFDTAIAMPVVAYGIRTHVQRAPLFFAYLFSYYALTTAYLTYGANFHHQMFFFPIGLLLVFFFSDKKSALGRI